MQAWASRSDAMERFEISFHYALAAQRQIHLGDLLRTLRAAARQSPFTFSNWVRICDYRYSHQPLNAYGSTIGAGGRFNYGDALDNIKDLPFPALYLASNEGVAHREFFAAQPSNDSGLTAHDMALMRERDYALYHVDGIIHHLLDLAKPAKLKKFTQVLRRFTVSGDVLALAKLAGINPRPLVFDVQSLTKATMETNWRGWSRQHGLPASCQVFGELAWSAGFEGVLYPSTKSGGQCLALSRRISIAPTLRSRSEAKARQTPLRRSMRATGSSRLSPELTWHAALREGLGDSWCCSARVGVSEQSKPPFARPNRQDPRFHPRRCQPAFAA